MTSTRLSLAVRRRDCRRFSEELGLIWMMVALSGAGLLRENTGEVDFRGGVACNGYCNGGWAAAQLVF